MQGCSLHTGNTSEFHRRMDMGKSTQNFIMIRNIHILCRALNEYFEELQAKSKSSYTLHDMMEGIKNEVIFYFS